MVQPEPFDAAHTYWSITGVPFEGEPQLSLFGELMVNSEDAMVAVTVTSQISYESPPFALDDSNTILNEVEEIGGTLVHTLWDAAADLARQLVAATRLTVDVPIETPEPTFSVQLFDDSPEEMDDADVEAGPLPAI